MPNASTITTTIQNTGSASVPQSNISFVEANANSPGVFTTLGTSGSPINTTPAAIAIPPNTTQICLQPTGAQSAVNSALNLCIGGNGVALANMLKMPLGAWAGSPGAYVLGTTLCAKFPVDASSPVVWLAVDVGSLFGLNVMFE